MSIKATPQVEGTEPEEFELAAAGETHVNIRNVAKDTVYTVKLTTDGSCALSCSCPDYKYRQSKVIGGTCKHMRSVEENTDDVDTSDEQERVTGPYTGYDCYGNVDHKYWRCESCGAEATREGSLENCC